MWMICLLLLSATLSVGSVVFGQFGAKDALDIYLLVEFDFDAADQAFLDRLEVQEIGIERAPLARMVFADGPSHQSMIEHGFWILPGSAVAAICGIRTS